MTNDQKKKAVKTKAKKQPTSHHAWAVFVDGVPSFMSACPAEVTDAKLRARVILEQYKVIFPYRKLTIGKATIMKGWL